MKRVRPAILKDAGTLTLLLLLLGGCKREREDGAAVLTASLIFDSASPEVREALALPVDFRINADNFARWETAQDNLDALPRSAIKPASTSGGNAVDRAVARLESSPRARRAVERAGLSVRDFVLATIALAQATEAAQTGRSTSSAAVPPENFQFVQRYIARVLRSQRQARIARAEAASNDVKFDTSGVIGDSSEGESQLRLEEAERDAEMGLAETEMRREEATQTREEAERTAELQREQEQRARSDSARDTLPARDEPS